MPMKMNARIATAATTIMMMGSQLGLPDFFSAPAADGFFSAPASNAFLPAPELSAFLPMFALLAFGTLFGFVGALLAVPVAAALGVLARFSVSRYEHSRLYWGMETPHPAAPTPPSIVPHPKLPQPADKMAAED